MSPVVARNGPSKFCGEGLMLRAERTWRGRYLRVTRVTPLALYREWIVQAARQGAGAAWPPLLGTTCARARWGTLAYVEKVRPQFLSLRQRKHSIVLVLFGNYRLLYRRSPNQSPNPAAATVLVCRDRSANSRAAWLI